MQSEQYTCGLGHLHGVKQQMAIASDRARPLLWSIFPDCGVRIEAEGQVVLNEVFARRLQITALQSKGIHNKQHSIDLCLMAVCCSLKKTVIIVCKQDTRADLSLHPGIEKG